MAYKRENEKVLAELGKPRDVIPEYHMNGPADVQDPGNMMKTTVSDLIHFD